LILSMRWISLVVPRFGLEGGVFAVVP